MWSKRESKVGDLARVNIERRDADESRQISKNPCARELPGKVFGETELCRQQEMRRDVEGLGRYTDETGPKLESESWDACLSCSGGFFL